MAFTQAQLDALEKAIARGQRKVRYGDKEIEYSSIGDMMTVRDTMKRELNGSGGHRRRLASFNRD